MPIRLLLNNDHSFEPEDITQIVAAFERALAALKLINREDPVVLIVAQKVIELAKEGERDPARLCEAVIESMTR